MSTKKTIDDLYDLFSRSLELQQQLLQSLHRLESKTDILTKMVPPATKSTYGTSARNNASSTTDMSTANVDNELRATTSLSSSIYTNTTTETNLSPLTSQVHQPTNGQSWAHSPFNTELHSTAAVNNPQQSSDPTTTSSNLSREITSGVTQNKQSTAASLRSATASLRSTAHNIHQQIMSNKYADQTSSSMSLPSNTQHSELQNATLVYNSSFNKVTPSNGNRRDILKTPPGSINRSQHSRLCSTLALLLSESEGTKIDANNQLVTSKLGQLKELSKTVYIDMLGDIAKQRQILIKEAMELKWAAISEELLQKYILMLEEKALKESDLDIGRCEGSWTGRYLLCITSHYFKLASFNVKQHYLNMAHKEKENGDNSNGHDNKLEASSATSGSSVCSSSHSSNISITTSNDSSLSNGNTRDFQNKPLDQLTSPRATSNVKVSSLPAAEDSSSVYNSSAALLSVSNKKPNSQEPSIAPPLPAVVTTRIRGTIDDSFSANDAFLATATNTAAEGNNTATPTTISIAATPPTSAKALSTISLAKTPARVPLVIAVDTDDSDESDSEYEESFSSFFEDYTSRKRTKSDTTEESSSSRKKEKCTREEDM